MKELIIAALQKSISDMGINYDGVIEISRPKRKENGDYASNIAMKLAGIMHDNPMNIAASLVDNFSCSQVTNIEIKAPGFINFFVAKDYLLENLKNKTDLTTTKMKSNRRTRTFLPVKQDPAGGGQRRAGRRLRRARQQWHGR